MNRRRFLAFLGLAPTAAKAALAAESKPCDCTDGWIATIERPSSEARVWNGELQEPAVMYARAPCPKCNPESGRTSHTMRTIAELS